MKARYGSLHLVSKFISTYEKLFEGRTPQEISPHEEPTRFWSNLLSLNVDRRWLSTRLDQLDKDVLMAEHKPFLNSLFSTCLHHFEHTQFPDSRKRNAIQTLSVLVRSCLQKGLAGWEVMELFAGNVSDSDAVFSIFMKSIDMTLSNDAAPSEVRHETLQLALTFACGIGQLSPGAYLLRRDLVPAITSVIKSPETQAFTFEAALLLSIIANFHKSDGAKLNPYLRSLRGLNDQLAMKTISWSATFALDSAIRAYQEISDDSLPTFVTSVGNLFASLRPDRALSATPVDPPRELFKSQPIEASVILLPLYELLHLNPIFRVALLGTLVQPQESKLPKSNLAPLPHALLTLSSYILTHASSVASPRAVAYANLCLNILLVCAESDAVMSTLTQPPNPANAVRLCRQRMPLLPLSPPSRPLLCPFLDCCVLWLRHNLHKRLEVSPFMTCIRVIRRVVWYLSNEKQRVDYHWQELWKGLIALLEFLSSKIDNLDIRGSAGQLMQETIILIDFAFNNAESFLGSPQALHQFVYEIVRSSSILQAQKVLFQHAASPESPRTTRTARLPIIATDALKKLANIATHYEEKVRASKARSAADVIHAISKEVDRDGLYGVGKGIDEDLATHREEPLDIGFIRYACLDGLALMPGPD